MEKYIWDENLLKKYINNPVTREDYLHAYEVFRNKKQFTLPSLQTNINLISSFYDSHAFLVPVLEKLLEEEYTTLHLKENHIGLDIGTALSLTKEFYQSTNSTISSIFNEQFARLDGRLWARPFTGHEKFAGHSLICPQAKDYLIDFKITNNETMLLSIVHEFSHVIAFYLQNCLNCGYEGLVFSETESIFTEHIACGYFGKIMGLNGEFDNYLKGVYNHFILDTANLIDMMSIGKIIAEMKKTNLKVNIFTIYLYTLRNYGYFPLLKYLEIIFKNIFDYVPYVYSYLISIELLEVYKRNPLEAWELYYKIINPLGKSPQEKNDTLYKLGINPGTHLKEYVKNLKR